MNMKSRLFIILFLLAITIPVAGQQKTIIVGFGETFETIAVKYGITLSDLKTANPGKERCYAGMKLIVPQSQISPIGISGVSSDLVRQSDSLLILAKAVRSSGQYKKAIKIYDKVINMSVRRAYGYAGRGECHYDLKNLKKAKSDLTSAINSGELASIEKSWCEDALEEVEKGLQAKREKRNRVWRNIGLAVAATAAVAATTYVASEQAKAQNKAYSQPSPTYSGEGSSHLSRADAIIAQGNAINNRNRALGTAQLNQMTQNMFIQAEQDKQHIIDVGKEQLEWASDFNKKNGRYPTEEEQSWWLYNNHRDIWELDMMGRAERHTSSSSGGNETAEENFTSSYNYEDSYRRWEARVQDWFGNLTQFGYDYKDKNGNIKGKAGDNMLHGGAYVGNKSGLRDAQNQMRKIRLEAEKHGIHIVQSKWETATANF